MQRAKWIAALCGVGFVVGFSFFGPPSAREYVSQLLESGEFLTLEARYSAQEIMEAHQEDLVRGPNHKYLSPGLKYYPYLLMDVKYSRSDKRTVEGVLLWSLVDGEMVLDTQSWATSHGFADCLRAGATDQDFQLIHSILRRRGSATKDVLKKDLGVDGLVLDRWLLTAVSKHLLVEYGSEYRLHFAHPVIDVTPETTVTERFVSKPYKGAERVSSRFSRHQIKDLACTAFGSRFAIRDTRLLYVPAYNIEVKNPDGTVMSSHWSALSGELISDEHVQ